MPRLAAWLSPELLHASERARRAGITFADQARRSGWHPTMYKRCRTGHGVRADDPRIAYLAELLEVPIERALTGVCPMGAEAYRTSLRCQGEIITFRCTRDEYVQLKRLAVEEAQSLSDLIREALAEWHGIGELHANSLSANPAIAERSQGRAVGAVLHTNAPPRTVDTRR
jgi:hypothetical protein